MPKRPGQPSRSRPSSRLVAHDIHLSLVKQPDGTAEVRATIECERRGCTLELSEVCRYCERFERIEAHEAGYTMLCRSTDEPDVAYHQDEHTDPGHADPGRTDRNCD